MNTNILHDFERYAKWEEKRNLFEWKVSGVKVWEYLRIIILDIVHKRECGTNYSIHTYVRENNEGYLKKIPRLLPKHIIHHKDVLFVNMAGKNILDGSLLEKLEYSYYILENNKQISKNTNYIYYDVDALSNKFVESYKINKKLYSLLNMIERDFMITFLDSDISHIKNVLYSVIQNRKTFMNYYKCILKLVRPKVIVLLGASSQYNKYLIEVAKELNITTIEYEHGLANANSIEDYYYCKRKISSYPDYRWTMGSATIYSYRLPIDNRNIIPVGNVFHEEQLKQMKELDNFSKKDDKNNILILSDFTVESRIAELAVFLSNKLDYKEYRIIFKLHPNEIDWKEKYPVLLNTRVVIKGIDNLKSIYYYAIDAEYVIGTVTTALAELAEFGKNVYIYGKSKLAICSEFLYKNHFAILVKDEYDLLGIIVNSKNDNLDNEKVKIWESNPVKNINRELRKCIGEKNAK